ncbi:MAG: hypothetical protein AVDCRST_MAG42-3197 [uncultured Chthoniobacterales bacterium]|uniref:Uncharacterized protein n=1 Tax=uncultured Chthoniobacterales bacterium TaxID=1836801 RepID=A0A6J4J224_9BACT|nr:MAG: hypothetical protein AVDCRST_MAG42-3197 [uncultured Chthoniobacterales bacterium]
MPHVADQWLVGSLAGALAICIVLALAMRRYAAGAGKRAAVFQIFILAASVVLLLAWTLLKQPRTERGEKETRPEWKLVGESITEGISGLAWTGNAGGGAGFLAVHDNKQPGQRRLSHIQRDARGQIEVRPLTWKSEPLPVDLEAICRIPGHTSAFLALTSKGALYRFTFDVSTSEITADSAPLGVPNAAEERQFESFDVQHVGAATVACWAERGDKDAAGVIFCSAVDLATLTFGEPQPLEVRAPWPTAHTRHVSDLRLLTNGTIIAASASDPGDDGPFAGAVYVAGSLHTAGDSLQLVPALTPSRLFTTTTRKIEALELVPGADGGMLLGSDDENRGAAVLFTW